MDMQSINANVANNNAVNGTPHAAQTVALIRMKKPKEAVSRQSYMVEKSIAEEWKVFNKNVPYKTVTLGWAMKRFMADVKAGRIKFELEI